jgi:hypothetical protein
MRDLKRVLEQVNCSPLNRYHTTFVIAQNYSLEQEESIVHTFQVPQYAKLYGYSRCDVHHASMSYIKPVSVSRLRSGPEVCTIEIFQTFCMNKKMKRT